MRLYTFEAKKHQRLGAELNGQLIDLNAAHAARLGRISAALAGSMIELIRGGEPALKRARQELAFAAKNPKRTFTYEFGRIKILAPIPRPGKIFCSGLNYRSHVEENPTATFLADPRFFVKVPSAVIGPGEAIRWPGAQFQVDYEVELATIVGCSWSRGMWSPPAHRQALGTLAGRRSFSSPAMRASS